MSPLSSILRADVLFIRLASFCFEYWPCWVGFMYSWWRLLQSSSQSHRMKPSRDFQRSHCDGSMYLMMVSTFWQLVSLQLSASSSYSCRKSSISSLMSPVKAGACLECAEGMVASLEACNIVL